MARTLAMVCRPDLQFLVSECYNHAAANTVTDYVQCMAPTLMVACVTLAADDDAQNTPSAEISAFMSHAQSTHAYLTRSASEN